MVDQHLAEGWQLKRASWVC